MSLFYSTKYNGYGSLIDTWWAARDSRGYLFPEILKGQDSKLKKNIVSHPVWVIKRLKNRVAGYGGRGYITLKKQQ